MTLLIIMYICEDISRYSYAYQIKQNVELINRIGDNFLGNKDTGNKSHLISPIPNALVHCLVF